MPYFLYKPQNIANVGGVFPKVGSEFRLGITERENFYLGYVGDPEKIEKIKNYFVCFLDDDTADGFKLLGLNKIPVEPVGDGFNHNYSFRDLTDEERIKQKKAERLIAKLKLRYSIDLNFQDLFDSVSDNAKLIRFLFHLLFSLVDILPEENKDKFYDIFPVITELKSKYQISDFALTEFELKKLLDRQFKLLDLIKDYKSSWEKEL